MKAIAQDEYGPADVLRLRDVAQPAAGEGEVLVRVRAAGVDPGVWICMTGRPYAARAAFGLARPMVAVRGRALAGVVAAAIDAAGCRPLALLRRALTPRGTLVLAGGGHDAGGLLGRYARQLRAPLAGMFTSQSLRGLTSRERAQDLEELGTLIESGQVSPVVGRTYPLAEAPDAIRYLAEGHALGKVVITI